MEEYARILNYAIPGFLILIAIEYGASCWMQLKVNRLFDTISSLSSGITNVVKDILGLSIIIISYTWMVNHWAIFEVRSELWLYIIAFIGLDFAGYWSHRFSHTINIFWNRHIIHHSSEEFNLACALRQSVSEIFAVFTILFLPMAILGVPAKVVAIVGPLHLFAQFWYHTRLIGRMGWLEYIIVTPSHHRVHHAINPRYMDKNYGQIFIIWDKMFGSFQPELDDDPPVYGITRPAQTWNPWIINYQHLWLMITDAWRTKSWQDKLRIWFMPTGWRPEDVKVKFPVESISDVRQQEKYHTEGSALFKTWVTMQLFFTLFFMMFLFNNIGNIPGEQIMIYGGFIFAMVFAFTSLMDGSLWAIFGEVVKLVCAGTLLYQWSFKWYTIDQVWSQGSLWIISYMIVSFVLTFYFLYIDKVKTVDYTLQTA
jgi:alkylglycerol monooxygenase